MKKILLGIGVAAAIVTGGLLVRAQQYDCSQSLMNTNSTPTVGISNSLAGFTTNTTQYGLLGMTRFDSVSLVATGKLSGAGTDPIRLQGYRSSDGLRIDTSSPVIITWQITPRGTLTFVCETNIPNIVIGDTGYVVFTDLANGNSTILSNFSVNPCYKPSHHGE